MNKIETDYRNNKDLNQVKSNYKDNKDNIEIKTNYSNNKDNFKFKTNDGIDKENILLKAVICHSLLSLYSRLTNVLYLSNNIVSLAKFNIMQSSLFTNLMTVSLSVLINITNYKYKNIWNIYIKMLKSAIFARNFLYNLNLKLGLGK